MDQIRVFVFRSAGYYGLGLTPLQSVESAVEAGMARKHIKSGSCVLLPASVTSVEVDGLGSVHWLGGEQGSKPVVLKYDPEIRKFVQPV